MAPKDKEMTFEVPEQMREFAEKSVDQARRAFDSFMAATQDAVTTVEGSASAVQSGAMDIGRKALAHAEQNVENAFDFAKKLVKAKDLNEVMALQQEFLNSQMAAFGDQTKEMGDEVMKTATEATNRKPD